MSELMKCLACGYDENKSSIVKEFIPVLVRSRIIKTSSDDVTLTMVPADLAAVACPSCGTIKLLL